MGLCILEGPNVDQHAQLGRRRLRGRRDSSRDLNYLWRRRSNLAQNTSALVVCSIVLHEILSCDVM